MYCPLFGLLWNHFSFAVTAIAHSPPINSTPSFPKDVVVIVIQNPFVAVAMIDHSAHPMQKIIEIIVK